MDIILSLRLDRLKDCINNPKKVGEIVNQTIDNSELTAEEKINYTHKATYLYYDYECTLKHLGEDEKKTWKKRCEEAMRSTGPLQKIINAATIMDWNKKFNKKKCPPPIQKGRVLTGTSGYVSRS